MLVAVQLSVPGSYLPPVFKGWGAHPPQTIISLPVQTAVCCTRAEGALVVLVAVQLSVPGLYLPPVLRAAGVHLRPRRSFRCRSTLPCAISPRRRVGGAGGRPTVGDGSYLPPVFKWLPLPSLRPRRSFRCRSRLPCDHLVQRARWWCWSLSNYRCWDHICRRCSK